MYSYQASKGRVGAYSYFDDAVRLIQARIGWLGVVIGEVRGFQRSPLCSRKESLMSDRPDNELCTWKQGDFGGRSWSRCRREDVQLDPEWMEGGQADPYQVHDVPPKSSRRADKKR